MNRISKTQSEIKVGQSYTEDRGNGRIFRFEVVEIITFSGEQFVRFIMNNDRAHIFRMPWRRFDGLVRAGVFVLSKGPTEQEIKLEMATEQNRRLTDRLRTIKNLLADL